MTVKRLPDKKANELNLSKPHYIAFLSKRYSKHADNDIRRSGHKLQDKQE